MLELEDELISEYVIESRESLALIEADLLAIERVGPAPEDVRVDHMLRAARSVRITSELLRFAGIGKLAHQIENLLVQIQSHQLALTPEGICLLHRAVDCMDELLENREAGDAAEVSQLLREISAFHSHSQSPSKGLQYPKTRKSDLRMLLVEDDFVCRLLLQAFLTRYGECHIAVNGREAVEAFRTARKRGQPYDLICMDIMMAEMDGREAVQQIRALEQADHILSTYGVKIFMTTTVTGIKEMSRCFVELCDAYLTKPIDLRKLLNHMRAYELVK